MLYIVMTLYLGSFLLPEQIFKSLATASFCDSKWEKVLETDAHGNVTFGSKEDLVSAVFLGSKIRIGLYNSYQDVQNANVKEKETCVQSLFQISRSEFQHHSNSYWWFINVCTTGNIHMSRWFVGIHSQPSETKTSTGVEWFVRHLGCDSKANNPLFCNTESGLRMCGSLKSLIKGIDDGAEIHVVAPNDGYSVKLTNIVHNDDNTMVSGAHLWHISQTEVNGRYLEFQKNAYWWFTLWSSNGFRDMSRWSVGEHIDRGHSNDRLPMKWFSDNCWTLAYEHDEHGRQIDGSLEFLKNAVLNGKRVRLVYYNHYAIEADVIVVRNGNVTAQVLGHVSKNSMEQFQSNAYWFWQNVGTTGKIETIRYNVGSYTSRGRSVGQQHVKWFIDLRPWKHVFSNSEQGSTIFGSKSSFIQQVKEGKMVRYTVNFKSDNPDLFVFNADNIGITPDGTNLGAQHVRYVGIKKDGPFDVIFESKPYWQFLIASTTGNVDQARWTVGLHESQGQTSLNASIDWFVS